MCIIWCQQARETFQLEGEGDIYGMGQGEKQIQYKEHSKVEVRKYESVLSCPALFLYLLCSHAVVQEQEKRQIIYVFCDMSQHAEYQRGH